jgi:hypothetical protein
VVEVGGKRLLLDGRVPIEAERRLAVAVAADSDRLAIWSSAAKQPEIGPIGIEVPEQSLGAIRGHFAPQEYDAVEEVYAILTDDSDDVVGRFQRFGREGNATERIGKAFDALAIAVVRAVVTAGGEVDEHVEVVLELMRRMRRTRENGVAITQHAEELRRIAREQVCEELEPLLRRFRRLSK